MVLLVADVFLPSGTSSLEQWFQTLLLMFILAAFLAMITVSFNSFRKHKIQKRVDKALEPKRGFKKQTYTSYELYCLLLLCMLGLQITVAVWLRNAWAITGCFFMAASCGLALWSRFILYNANKDLMFVPPPLTDEQKKEYAKLKEQYEFYMDEPEKNTVADTAADTGSKENAAVKADAGSQGSGRQVIKNTNTSHFRSIKRKPKKKR